MGSCVAPCFKGGGGSVNPYTGGAFPRVAFEDERSGTKKTFDGGVAERRNILGRDWSGMEYFGLNVKELIVVHTY